MEKLLELDETTSLAEAQTKEPQNEIKLEETIEKDVEVFDLFDPWPLEKRENQMKHTMHAREPSAPKNRSFYLYDFSEYFESFVDESIEITILNCNQMNVSKYFLVSQHDI
ncbi:hypothetical protein WA026_017383 [Henosepilachna vigintioctopunctata]|uniref:Uncharacterized protein n=1 Tax=Henosepilachna vigintioctopunctata TaxID=420089 RepID=A0AAW1VHV9_9CUCU